MEKPHQDTTDRSPATALATDDLQRILAEEMAKTDAEIVQQAVDLLLYYTRRAGAAAHQPYADRVLIKPLAEDNLAHRRAEKSGLYVPVRGTQDQNKAMVAVVIASGPGRFSSKTGRRIPTDVSPGDTILCGRYVGDGVPIGDQMFRLIKAGDVLAVLDLG